MDNQQSVITYVVKDSTTNSDMGVGYYERWPKCRVPKLH